MQEINPRVAVLILGFNDKDNLDDAISSVLNQSYAHYETYYIDNASSNQSLEFVQAHFPGVKTIAHAQNLGYAGAYAKVLTRIFQDGFEAAVLLNSDVRVHTDWLKELVRSAYADERIGFAQPKIFLWGNEQHLANTFGNEIHYLGLGFCGHYKMPDSADFSHDKEITYPSGASLFIKREAYIDVGGIDPDFFSYLEDQDLVWRGRILGWKSVLSARSYMWHKYVFRNPSRSKWKFHMYERNRLFFIMKNYSSKLIVLILPALIALEVGMLIDSLQKGYFLDKIRAYRDVVATFPRTLRKRALIQNTRRKSDRDLFAFFSPEITFSEIQTPVLGFANYCLKGYYTLIRWLI